MSDRHFATFYPYVNVLQLWLSPNMCGYRNCKTLEEARKLIAATGVTQTLRSSDEPAPR